MKINDVIFGMDNSFIRFETDKGKIYFSKGKYYKLHPINPYAEALNGPVVKEIELALSLDDYHQSKDVKSFIKKNSK